MAKNAMMGENGKDRMRLYQRSMRQKARLQHIVVKKPKTS